MNSDCASALLLEEYFETGDARFLEELFRSRSEKKLKSLAERWSVDARPFARQALLGYIDDGCDRPGHRALVKGLFKRAEARGDDEAMGPHARALPRVSRFVAPGAGLLHWLLLPEPPGPPARRNGAPWDTPPSRTRRPSPST